MKVMKFGGTSVGTPAALASVKNIVESSPQAVIVVVSALGGITDMLIETARRALGGDPSYEDSLESVMRRHLDLIAAMVPESKTDRVIEQTQKLFGELCNIYKGVYLIRDLSVKTSDAIESYGERLSSLIVAAAIEGAELKDSREFIKTRSHFGKHSVDFEATDSLIRETFADLPPICVVPGFISSDVRSGDTTTLGRGGSDYTASIIASALGASVLEIWTDVDGFMTADPRMVPNAYVIENLSYVEAIELCNVGAKVIYPPTIFPVFHRNIPIVVRNTFNPASAGTYISAECPSPTDKVIRGLSSLTDTCLVTVQGLGMVGIIGVNYRIFKALSKAGISCFFVAQAASENNTSIGVRTADSQEAVRVLSHEFAEEISQGEINPVRRECDLATIAIVGENMKKVPGVIGKLFETLGRNGINVVASASGALENNISFVVRLENQRKAMNVIHDSFFLSQYQVLNIFLAGTGLVGGNLLDQIRKQQQQLMEENSLKIRVVGISNSKKYILDRDGLELEDYQSLLAGSQRESTPEKFRDAILEMNIFNSVFVDCTASGEVAAVYGSLLARNISVVTANKVAASSSYEIYSQLKQSARRNGVKFLFETNVGAGLPVINTMSDLRKSGDRILKIEAVVSGTLNYIFDNLSADVPLSKAVKMAQQAGFAEPDPRTDLSGLDVVRKLVILSREAGYRLEVGDVCKNLFIPENYFEGSVQEFWKSLPELDDQFEQQRLRIAAEGKRLRFVASFDGQQAQVGLREVTPDSPFYNLAGSNNVILLTSERYREYPMQIKGYGAGAAVTAAGVFADIISIANIS